MPIGVSLQLHDGATQQANLTGIQALWWDVTEPKDAGKPIGKSVVVTTDASGYISLDLSSVSGLTVGASGFLMLYKLDATNHENSLIFSGKVVTSTVASGVMLAAVDGWNRPADWLPMPATAANQIDVLAAVFDHESNYCSFRIALASGTYDVDWGDGTSDLAVASGVKIDHLYNYADPDLAGTLSVEGYKQAMIKITPSSGSGNIIEIRFGERHSRTGLVTNVANPWLEVQCNTPGLTTLALAFCTFNAALCSMLERVEFVALGNVTSLYYTFYSCYSLQSVGWPAGSLTGVTTLAYAFQNCYTLRSVTWPAGSLANVTTLGGTFQNCYTLRSVTWPVGSLANVTSLDVMFQYCYALQSVVWPVGSLANVTSLWGTFQYCYALQSVVWPVGSLELVTSTTNLHASNFSLANISNCAIPITFSVAVCKLSGEALNEIYTALPTVSAKTITVSGNHGVVDDDPSIAVAKGWTVTG